MTAAARPLQIRQFRETDRAAIERLNHRLEVGGAPDRVEPGPADNPASLAEGRAIRERLFIATDGVEVRGGVWLKEQGFRVGSRDERFGWVKYPVAESLVDPDFAGVPGALLFQLLREQPRLLAFGMGGHQGPFARFLAKMKWAGQTVPLLLYPNHPGRVLRQYAGLIPSPLKRLLLQVAAWSGMAWLALSLRALRFRAVLARQLDGVEIAEVPRFGQEADTLWLQVRDETGFQADRGADTLNALYPERSRGVHRLHVSRANRFLGWAVVFLGDRNENGTSAFGQLALGVIADGAAEPRNRPALLAACHRFLLDRDADLVISNQSHPAWQHDLRALGYLAGPDRFAFYQSPAVTRLLGDISPDRWYFTRGDCHGGDWA